MAGYDRVRLCARGNPRIFAARDPSLDFDTNKYLAANPDVKARTDQSAPALPAARHRRAALGAGGWVWG
jgi:hypothetical protein